MQEQQMQEKTKKPAKTTKTAKAAKAAVAETPVVQTSADQPVTAAPAQAAEKLVISDKSTAAPRPQMQGPRRNNNYNNRPQQRPFNNQQPLRQPNGAKVLDARELNKLSVAELTKLAVNYNLEDISGLRKQELIGRIMAIQAKQNGSVYGGGVLEILPDGFGFLRSEENNYLSSGDDIYVSPSQIKRFGLRRGDTIEGLIRPPKDNERYFAMLQVQKVNGVETDKIYNRPLFENLTPLHPNERFTLET